MKDNEPEVMPSSVSGIGSGTACEIVSESGELLSPVTTGQPKLSVSVKRKEKPSSKPGPVVEAERPRTGSAESDNGRVQGIVAGTSSLQ